MPWKENRAMDLRVQLIQEHAEGQRVSALAEIYDIARQPFVNRLARDVIDLGQRRNPLTLGVFLNQLDTQVHSSVFLPRHRFPACRCGTQNLSTPINCHPSPRSEMSPISPVWTVTEPRPQGTVSSNNSLHFRTRMPAALALFQRQHRHRR